MHKAKYTLCDGKIATEFLKTVSALKKPKFHTHINTEQNLIEKRLLHFQLLQ